MEGSHSEEISENKHRQDDPGRFPGGPDTRHQSNAQEIKTDEPGL
jgi:hypothetical protein